MNAFITLSILALGIGPAAPQPPTLLPHWSLSFQVTSRAQTEAAVEVKSFMIRYAEAEEVSNIVMRLLGSDGGGLIECVTDQRTNQIFVRGRNSAIKQCNALIEQLDTPAKADGSRTTEILTTRHRGVDDLYEVIKIHSTRGGKVVVDEARDVIVMNDTPDAIAKAREIIARLDQKGADLSLNFTVLGPSETPLPEQFGMVADELENLGFEGYGVLSRSAVICQENGDFSLTGANDFAKVQVSGDVRLIREGNQAELRINMNIMLNAESGRRQSAPITASIMTTVKLPLGELVILGVTPAGGNPNEPLVLVARANRQ